jgi:hypothetical protein
VTPTLTVSITRTPSLTVSITRTPTLTPTPSVGNTLLSNIVSYWKLDEASGSVIDSVGSNNGTCNGTYSQNQSGKIGKSIGFTGGGSGYVDFGNIAALRAPAACTISLWVYITGFTKGQTFVNKVDWGLDRYGWSFEPRTTTGLLSLWLSDSGSTVTYTSNLTISGGTSSWQHCVCSWNGTTVNIYLNNAKYSVAQTNSPTDNNYTVKLSTDIATYSTAGRLDEVGIWNRQLTDAEVGILYNSGAGNQYPFV